MKNLYTLFCLLILTSFATQAQNIQWQFHSYHAVDLNLYEAYAVTESLDGGYVYAGRSGSNGFGNADFYIAKVDSAGKLVWSRIYATPFDDEARSIVPLSDGSFVVSGFTVNLGNVADSINYKNFMMKINSDGDSLWTKRYYSGTGIVLGEGLGYSVDTTYDGGFVMVGKYATTTSSFDFYLLRTDANGDTLWTKKYGGAGSDIPRCVKQTADSGFIITGTTKSFGNNPSTGNIWLIKTNSMGDTLWTKIIGGNDEQEGYSVGLTNDKGYILTGSTGNNSSNSVEIYVLKTDSLGNIQWSQTFGTPEQNNLGRSIINTTDGGYALAGWVTAATGDFSGIAFQMYLLKMDAQGNKQWDKALGNTNSANGAQGFCIQQTKDGGFIAAGQDDADTLQAGEDIRAYIVKIASSTSTGISPIANKVVLSEIYPNPSIGNCIVNITSSSENKALVVLFDETGQKVWNTTEQLQSGNNSFNYSFNALASGIYFLTINSDTLSETHKLVIIK